MPQKPPHARKRAARPQAPPARAALPPFAVFAAVQASAGDAPITAGSAEAVPPPAATAPSGISVASATAFGAGSNGGEGGHGTGGMGDGPGSSFAHVEYGHNPAPIYPVEARRRAEHGTVLLRIKVAVDGAVELVEIAQSSGFDLLDNEALETVRSRWRFVPARRDGVAVESWCEVPIRFALTEAQAN
jgi:protein TonB